ncbi:putative transposase YbfD/YdcC [Lipingzhangella halophila]|uniref:Putative transposase YbfD/YdcC n=1 Tax=Lipingzhangella halophila TaxID=1783352 RepID=A0A7W7REV9_9ACTN|nr:ISAs1 family transposase [Lipingzhangella halophila]MBB4930670.1 putative transposase YbfD/YdcC [Lipingzhangella halophila]
MPHQSATPQPAVGDLAQRLTAVDDPRDERGIRHEIGTVLVIALCALLCGSRSLRAIGQWAANTPQHTRTRLGCRITDPELGLRTAPSTSTIRRVLLACTPAGVAALARPDSTAVLALDGETLRGSATAQQAATHVLAALAPGGRIAAQVPVAGKTSEIAAVEDLLGPLDIDGTVVTADALHTQTSTARYLAEQRGADYILTVKRNQPSLFEQVTRLPWAQAPTGDTDRHRAHGRAETRTVKALSIEVLGFPHAVQAVRIRRHVTDLRTGEVSWTCAYAVTSLPAERAGAARLGGLVRGHWAIEALHHVRDSTFAEDACKVRTGHGPANLAALRSLAALLLSALKRPTIPDAIRWVSYACFTHPLDLIGLA